MKILSIVGRATVVIIWLSVVAPQNARAYCSSPVDKTQQLCPNGASVPCVVNGHHVLQSGSTISVGSLTLGSGAKVEFSGCVEIHADSADFKSGSKITSKTGNVGNLDNALEIYVGSPSQLAGKILIVGKRKTSSGGTTETPVSLVIDSSSNGLSSPETVIGGSVSLKGKSGSLGFYGTGTNVTIAGNVKLRTTTGSGDLYFRNTSDTMKIADGAKVSDIIYGDSNTGSGFVFESASVVVDGRLEVRASRGGASGSVRNIAPGDGALNLSFGPQSRVVLRSGMPLGGGDNPPTLDLGALNTSLNGLISVRGGAPSSDGGRGTVCARDNLTIGTTAILEFAGGSSGTAPQLSMSSNGSITIAANANVAVTPNGALSACASGGFSVDPASHVTVDTINTSGCTGCSFLPPPPTPTPTPIPDAPCGTFLTQWGSYGSGPGQFNYTTGVAVDGSGNVFVADFYNYRIQKFDSTGTFLTMWGSFGSGPGQFKSPYGVAVDASGNVFVADFYNNRIQKFDSTGTFLTMWGSAGSGPGQFNSPVGVAVDGSGNVFVADFSNNRIQKFDSTGTFLTMWGGLGSGPGEFSQPNGVAVDASGNVFVADSSNNRIQKFDSTGTFLTMWGSVGSGPGQFNHPTSVAVDGSGNVFVADYSNYRIQKFNSTGTFLTMWGSSGGGPGQFISYPYGVAVDASGNVFVSDDYGYRILKFACPD